MADLVILSSKKCCKIVWPWVRIPLPLGEKTTKRTEKVNTFTKKEADQSRSKFVNKSIVFSLPR